MRNEGIIPELDPALCEYDVIGDESGEFPEQDGGKVVCGYDESFYGALLCEAVISYELKEALNDSLVAL